MTGRGNRMASPSAWLPGIRMLPGERAAQRAEDKIRFVELGEELRAAYSPRILYAAMLFWVRSRDKKDGMAHYCFVAMFGASEKRSDRGDPVELDDPRFEEWIRLRQEFSDREWRNAKARTRAKTKRRQAR